MSPVQAVINGVSRGVAASAPAEMPPLARVHYAREVAAWSMLSVMLGAIEGGVVGVIAKNYFEGAVRADLLNVIVAILVAAPAFANVTSFIWADIARGRDKVRLLVLMQSITIALTAQVALAPKSTAGLAMLAIGVIGGRVCWAGVVTLRSTVWRANYPRSVRPTLAGRLATVQAVMLTATSLTIGAVLSMDDPDFRPLYLVAAGIGVGGVLVYRRMRVRRQKSLLEAERRGGEDAGGTKLAGPRLLLDVLRSDRPFRNYMTTMFVFGIGNLSTAPLVVIVARDRLEFGYLGGILLSATLSTLIMPFAIPWWSRLLDRMHILRFRAYHCWTFVAAGACFISGAALEVPALMIAGALCKGVGFAGGVLGWNLGHHDFAPPERTSDYMAVHVTLTGVRGIIGPLAVVALYNALEAWHPGRGWMAFGACMGLSLLGSYMFFRMRSAGQALRD